MTAPARTTWTVADDADGDLTLWRGDTAVLRRWELRPNWMNPEGADRYRNQLWDVLTRVLAPDEATIERLRDHVNQLHPTHQNDETGDVFCGCGYVYGDGQTHGISAVLQGLAALAGTSAQARQPTQESGMHEHMRDTAGYCQTCDAGPRSDLPEPVPPEAQARHTDGDTTGGA